MPSTSNVSSKKNNKRKRSNDAEDEIDINVCKIQYFNKQTYNIC
jgi:hypothetical protein